jgi:hypothetical protein
MTYHITKIDNNSSKSAVITNPAPKSDPGWQDSRLVLPRSVYTPQRPIMVNFIEGAGDVPYKTAATSSLNIYTTANNWCFWDNGNSALNGVGESEPMNVNFYNGGGGDIKLTVREDGTVGFASA